MSYGQAISFYEDSGISIQSENFLLRREFETL